MWSYFRNCKHCGFGFFKNNFTKVDLFCKDCWFLLEIAKSPLRAIFFKGDGIAVRSLYVWTQERPIVGNLIHGLKGGTPINVLTRLSIEIARKFYNQENCIIVPIPSSKVGEKDHAYLIAKCIAETLDIPMWDGLIWENKTKNQKFLNKTERFRASMKKTKSLPRNSKIILVDDLVTSGATIMAAKRAIQSLKPIEVWTLACRI